DHRRPRRGLRTGRDGVLRFLLTGGPATSGSVVGSRFAGSARDTRHAVPRVGRSATAGQPRGPGRQCRQCRPGRPGRAAQSGIRVPFVNRSAALADAAPISFWLDDPTAPPANPPLVGRTDADLTVVGGGYTGLWTALLSKSANPERNVVLLEAGRTGWAASGRNGGFCAASLTHGLANGIERFPHEMD